MLPETSYLSRIRGVPLLPDERVAAILNTESGLIAEPSGHGRLLVATDRRVIDLAEGGRTRTTEMFAAGSVAQVSLREDARRGLSWKHWATLVGGGLAVYLILAYWLVDRLPSVIIPVVNLHAFALLIMALVVLAGWLFWRGLTQSGGRRIQVAGVNWSLEAECEADYDDLQEFANALLLMQSSAKKADGSVPL